MIENLENEVDMIERHLRILRLVVENGPIGIVALSNETDIPHHKVRYSLRILEEEDLIEPTSQGATTTENTAGFLENHQEEIDRVKEKLENMRIGQESLA